tara:strand:+ start:199 stop:429 length:231 start_codon:yes stop_codon:yes gene_type:complete
MISIVITNNRAISTQILECTIQLFLEINYLVLLILSKVVYHLEKIKEIINNPIVSIFKIIFWTIKYYFESCNSTFD